MKPIVRIPILLYHAITDTPESWIAPYTVTPDDLRRHLDLVEADGSTVLTVTDLREAIARDRLPEKPIVLTFDDGFADFADAAAVLHDRGLRSTLYVTTGCLRGRPQAQAMRLPPAPMLDWSQLPELVEQGVEIGAHTHTHPQLDTVDGSTLEHEVTHCKRLLEDAIGAEVASFAYPQGFHSRNVVRAVRSAGYRSAAAVMNATSSQRDRAFTLARWTVMSSTTHQDVASWVAGSDPVAPFPEKLRTKAWRAYRRLRGESTRGVFTS